MTKTVTSMTMTMKPAEICQMPATMHTGLTVKQADTPKTIATREEKDFANIWARKNLVKGGYCPNTKANIVNRQD